jgi:hypothetical protein
VWLGLTMLLWVVLQRDAARRRDTQLWETDVAPKQRVLAAATQQLAERFLRRGAAGGMEGGREEESQRREGVETAGDVHAAGDGSSLSLYAPVPSVRVVRHRPLRDVKSSLGDTSTHPTRENFNTSARTDDGRGAFTSAPSCVRDSTARGCPIAAAQRNGVHPSNPNPNPNTGPLCFPPRDRRCGI